ncbi:MAG: carbamoyl-phosphate synthase (glutamine-hydrolyzing) large subunit [Andreesenia angusta]|nr:carbamoyl-phosphate synthase (glutamine-hydrolyzing) large subunit [Andreesenia angusta]
MPLNKSLKSVLIIGSGPIVIGQAAEFDYSGTQACKSIKEEGIRTILINSNPATIMTDMNVADKVYIEPITIDTVEKIIEKERPDGLLAGFGGQTALNLAMNLKDEGILDKYNVKLLGVKPDTIKKAEDREAFKDLMEDINEPTAKSIISTKIEECKEFVKENGYPVIIRPAYTLGGTGGGTAHNEEELEEICASGFHNSPIGQILLEQSVAGWKEVEFEVMRDAKGNSMVICSMENLDPVGVHTGDSVVVAPAQTLASHEYNMLRTSALKILENLDLEGGCNIQFALDYKSDDYIVIEVNPRVSRSSALASKAAGYPIAKIASKIAIGYTLDELKNYVTKTSSAYFEPSIDYTVIKYPKWAFDKFAGAARKLGTQMKATGEVMSIARTFESAMMKALTSLESKNQGMRVEHLEGLSNDELLEKIEQCDDERMMAIAQAIRQGVEVDKINDITKIDKLFLNGIKNIVNMEEKLKTEELNSELLLKAKKMGIADKDIAILKGVETDEITKLRKEYGIKPVYKMVDTCAAEFDAHTPYYYSSFEDEDENEVDESKESIIVLGSGPIRIGQGVEFDYCCVHGVWAIKEAGYESIIINNNPETVSTDFDTSDKLYFESLFIEDVMSIIEKEKPKGVVVQFGGQTSINLAEKLHRRGINILGTSYDSIDLAEDREKFGKLLSDLNIPSPSGGGVTNLKEGLETANKLGYPVIVRPSYVIGGRAMQVVYDDEVLKTYMTEAVTASKTHPVLIDKYVRGTEIEVDAICDGEDILIPGIMEHVERTGVHSGDSITVYPTITLPQDVKDKLYEYTKSIAVELKTKGLINIQYVYDGKDIYVIEVNPRASRTVPILSKITGTPMVKIAVEIMLGKKLSEMEYGVGLIPPRDFSAIKIPVFSTEKLGDVDVYLGPEMKSTGEVLGMDNDFENAVYKAFKATNTQMPLSGGVYVAIKDVDKEEDSLEIIKGYKDMGFRIYASMGTSKFLNENGVEAEALAPDEIENRIANDDVKIIINTPTKGNDKRRRGFKLRRKGSEHRIPVFTCIDTAELFLKALKIKASDKEIEYRELKSYFNK